MTVLTVNTVNPVKYKIRDLREIRDLRGIFSQQLKQLKSTTSARETNNSFDQWEIRTHLAINGNKKENAGIYTSNRTTKYNKQNNKVQQKKQQNITNKTNYGKSNIYRWHSVHQRKNW